MERPYRKFPKSLKGLRFNLLTVLEDCGTDGRYRCLCDCGNETWVRKNPLTREHNPTKSCGCLRVTAAKGRLKPLDGQRFDRLLVTGRAMNHGPRTYWKALCDCGQTTEVWGDSLMRGTTGSCGCKNREQNGSSSPSWKGHGEIPLNWWNARVVKRGNAERYGRRAKVVTITIEYAWDLFLKQDRKCALTGETLSFKEGALNRASLDRINSSIGYVPGNVQWVSKTINLMKHTLSVKDFVDKCKEVASYRQKV